MTLPELTGAAASFLLVPLCNSGLKTLGQRLSVSEVTSALTSEHFPFQCSSSGYQSCFSICAPGFYFHKSWTCLSSQLHGSCSIDTSLAGDSWALALLPLLHSLSLFITALHNKLDCPSCLQTLQLLAGGFQDPHSLLSQAVHI